MAAIAFSLLASICWGLADFTAGLKSRRLSVLLVLLWVDTAGLIVILGVIGASGEPLPSERTVLYALVAGAVGSTALGAFYKALSIGTMSIVAPISATGVMIPVIVGLVSGDTLTLIVAIGMAAAIAGVLLASREEVDELAEGGPNRGSILLALAAAAGFGLYFAFADIAADGSVLWLLALGRVVVIPVLALLLAATRSSFLPPPRDRWQLAIIGCFDLTATGLYGVATTKGELSIVAVVGSLYPVVTVLLARGVLHERISRMQAVGVALALAGVGLVSAGG